MRAAYPRECAEWSATSWSMAACDLKPSQRYAANSMKCYLIEGGSICADATQEERLRTYELSAELDKVTEDLHAERTIQALIKEENCKPPARRSSSPSCTASPAQRIP